MVEDIGGRKFIFTLMSVVLITLLLLVGAITQDIFKELMLWIGGFFTAGNAVDHVSDKF